MDEKKKEYKSWIVIIRRFFYWFLEFVVLANEDQSRTQIKREGFSCSPVDLKENNLKSYFKS